MAKLHILYGKRKGEVIDIQPGPEPFVIGSRKSAEISIRDPWVSWDHAALHFDGKQFWLEDLGSSNGTYVNKQRIQKIALNDGDTIWFGKTKVRFYANDAAAPAATARAGAPAAAAAPSAEAIAQAVAAATAPLNQQLLEAQTEIARLKVELEQSRAAAGRDAATSEQLEALRQRNAELEQELERQKQLAAELARTQAEEIAQLEQRLAAAEAAGQSAGAEVLAEAQARAQQLEQELERQKQLAAELARTQAEEIAQLEQRLAAAEA
ncbi:MAG: FHA domain-containing protein, partial [Planctomycetota bacterium]